MSNFKAVIQDAHSSSDRLGNCELCKKYCSSIFSLRVQKLYFNTIKQQASFTSATQAFGCESCLKDLVKAKYK